MPCLGLRVSQMVLCRSSSNLMSAAVQRRPAFAAQRFAARAASTVAPSRTADVVIVGGGIVGVSIARELAERHPSASITLLEKESAVAQHGSGRNSGVLHAGFYYDENSLRAKFCREGNQYLHWFCKKHNLSLNPCGKLVVAQSPDVLPGLHNLYERGQRNGVQLELVSEARAAELEPIARTYKEALWSPTTAAADCTEVTGTVAAEAKRLGVAIETGCLFQGATVASSASGGVRVQTSQGEIQAGHLVNAAGLYADKVAHSLGFGEGYRMLPFKGLYLYCNVPLTRLLYPVPDLETNVLGVHYTVTVDGKSGFDNFSLEELVEVLGIEALLFLRSQFGFRSMALREIKKYWKPFMIGTAKELVRGAKDSDFTTYGKPGIRAQLVDVAERKLVMDFMVQGDEHSTHVLNAVSPAWTCSYPFAQHICDSLQEKGVLS